MILTALEMVVYTNPGVCHSDFARPPSWPDVERALRKLDRSVRPAVYLHVVDVDEDWDELSHSLDIFGGAGEYALEAWLPEETWRYSNPGREGESINLLLLDPQGGFMPAVARCSDLELVLAAARR